VVRVLWWDRPPENAGLIELPQRLRLAAALCMVGMIYLGLFPARALAWAEEAARVLAF